MICVVKESMFEIENTKKTTERMLDRLSRWPGNVLSSQGETPNYFRR